MPIIRPYVAPYSPEFRHQAVLLTRSRTGPVSHVARELGISNDSLRDWITRARRDPRQLHERTLCETGQAELVRLRADKHRLLREIAILRDALALVASEATTNETGQAVTVPPGTGDQGDQADLPTALRFAAVVRLASRWPVATLCQAMGVSRSGYYAWKDRLRRLAADNPRRVASDALGMAIQDCHVRSRGPTAVPASMPTSSRTASAAVGVASPG